MKPYYEDDLVTLYNGSCLDVDQWLTADVLVTDPPYGLNADLAAGHRGKAPPGGHKRTSDRPAWDETVAVRDAALAMWGGGPSAVFASPIQHTSFPPFREFPLIWDKQVVGMGDTTFPFGRSYELIYVAGDGWNGQRRSSVIRVQYSSSLPSKVGHPTPKPVPLMEEIIRHAPPGSIADPFAGGGSTLMAAKSLGRPAVGVELSERFCEIAANRLSQDLLDFGTGA